MTIAKMKRLMADGSLRAINAWLTGSAASAHAKSDMSIAPDQGVAEPANNVETSQLGEVDPIAGTMGRWN
jgi:hypothetical protein